MAEERCSNAYTSPYKYALAVIRTKLLKNISGEKPLTKKIVKIHYVH